MRLLVATLWALFLTAACAAGGGGLSEAEILGQAPLVHAREGAGGKSEVFPEAFGEDEAERRLESARDAYLREDFDECLRIVGECLSRGVPEPLAREFRTLRFDAKRRIVKRTILRVRVLPERDVVAMGEPARVSLLLRNVSGVEVRISRAVHASSPSSFFLDVTRQDWDIYGNVRSETTRTVLPLEDDVVLAPGAEKTIPWSVDTPEPERRHLGFTILRVGGVLRPAGIHAGEQEVYTAVDLDPGEVRAFPPGYEPLAADPLGSLDKAFDLGAREHLLVAAGLLGPGDRERGVEKLVSYLGGPVSPVKRTVMGALRLLTGLSFADRQEAWIDWWRSGAKGENGR